MISVFNLNTKLLLNIFFLSTKVSWKQMVTISFWLLNAWGAHTFLTQFKLFLSIKRRVSWACLNFYTTTTSRQSHFACNNSATDTSPFKFIFSFFQIRTSCIQHYTKGGTGVSPITSSLLLFLSSSRMFTRIYNLQYCERLLTPNITQKHDVYYFYNSKTLYWQSCFFNLMHSYKFKQSYFGLTRTTDFFFWIRDSNLFPRERISTSNLFLYYFSFFTNNYYFKHTVSTRKIMPTSNRDTPSQRVYSLDSTGGYTNRFNYKKFRTILKPNKRQDGETEHNRFKDLSVFQLRPGYKRVWKSYRSAHAQISPYNFFRQRRWTNYFLSLSRANSTSLLHQLEFSLFWVAYSSYLFFSQYSLLFFIFKQYVYVNGFLPTTPNCQIYLGDVIQLRTDVTSILYLLRCSFFFLAAKKKLLYKFFLNLKKNYIINNSWQLKLNFFFDVPNYLEVDFTVLTIIPVYYPVLHFEKQPFISFYLPASAIKVYNWKYIN